MRNCEVTVNGNIMTVKVDLTKRLGPSKSGKTEIVASSDGIYKVKTLNIGEFGVGVNVFTDRAKGQF